MQYAYQLPNSKVNVDIYIQDPIDDVEESQKSAIEKIKQDGIEALTRSKNLNSVTYNVVSETVKLNVEDCKKQVADLVTKASSNPFVAFSPAAVASLKQVLENVLDMKSNYEDWKQAIKEDLKNQALADEDTIKNRMNEVNTKAIEELSKLGLDRRQLKDETAKLMNLVNDAGKKLLANQAQFQEKLEKKTQEILGKLRDQLNGYVGDNSVCTQLTAQLLQVQNNAKAQFAALFKQPQQNNSPASL